MTKRTYDRVMSAVLYASGIGLVVGLRARGWSDGPILLAFLAFGCACVVVFVAVHHFARPHLRYPIDLPAYVDRVVGYLADEFDWDDQTKAIARRHLDNQDGYGAGFGFICDHPASAMYRLKGLSIDDDPWALRMAYYGYNPERDARAVRISRELRKLRYAKAVAA